jgi:ABC-type branched-subunit amino acid transport system permease subunit
MHHAIMGAVFIATVLWAPDGLVGLAGRIHNRLFGKSPSA